jgi:CheY-like chemotaxis protein
MDAMRAQAADILIVDDDPGDALLIGEGFQRGENSSRSCHVARDGHDALRFVRRTDPYTDAPRPRLILLDLNLPGVHGLEVLAALKKDASLRSIPVVILSSSSHPEDIERSYALHANAFITKPIDLDALAAAISTIDACFLELAEPSPEAHRKDAGRHPVLEDQ